MGLSVGVRLLAVLSTTGRSILREKLAPLDGGLTCVTTVQEITDLYRRGESFEVVLLPERLDDFDWWLLWGEISVIDPPPAILVYSKQPNLKLLTAVLDLGGYGVVSEPFNEYEIRQVINDAAAEFRSRDRTTI